MVARHPAIGKGTVVVEAVEEEEPLQRPSDMGDDDYKKASFTTLRYSYPLKILVPSYATANHCKWVYPVTFGGGLVGGDSIHIDIKVRENCCVLLSGQESTKIYHCEDDKLTKQLLSCDVEAGAMLCVLSDPVVCFKDANFLQTQIVRMSSLGNLVYLDWLIGGRVALGELWQFDSYQNKTDIYIDDQLVYRDNYHMCDSNVAHIQRSMAQYQVIGTIIILGEKLQSLSADLIVQLGKSKPIGDKGDPDLVWSVSALQYRISDVTVSGLYIRFLAASSEKAYSGVIHHVIEPLLPTLGGNPFKNKY